MLFSSFTNGAGYGQISFSGCCTGDRFRYSCANGRKVAIHTAMVQSYLFIYLFFKKKIVSKFSAKIGYSGLEKYRSYSMALDIAWCAQRKHLLGTLHQLQVGDEAVTQRLQRSLKLLKATGVPGSTVCSRDSIASLEGNVQDVVVVMGSAAVY